jgi:hypothetical protein
MPEPIPSRAQGAELYLELGEQGLRWLYVTARASKSGGEDELAAAETLDFFDLLERVAVFKTRPH